MNNDCIKCGSDTLPEQKYCEPQEIMGVEIKEHMHNHCLVCGYEWSGPCNDEAKL